MQSAKKNLADCGWLPNALCSGFLLIFACSCETSASKPGAPKADSPTASSQSQQSSTQGNSVPTTSPGSSANLAAKSAPSTTSAASAAPVASALYPWLSDPSIKSVPSVSDSLESRFAPPAGYRRVDVKPGSFGAWLRTLPLAAAGTPVLSYSGNVIRPADHDNIAAVVAIDIGQGDLQQCADSIIRLHAEWQWSKGLRTIEYPAAAGTMMPFVGWLRGERPVAEGSRLRWEPKANVSENNHASFRKYLNDVFGWANTGSLMKQGKLVELKDIQPGDYVIQAGAPGHTVLFLDIAESADGKRVALLGQGFMPAQSFQVLRPTKAATLQNAWYPIDPNSKAIETPFWEPFAWSSLRRLTEK